MTLLLILEIIGTIAFAISGACVAIEKKMDIFGVVILGMTTAVGGGIIRDLILGETPPAAFQEPYYAGVAIAVSIFVFIPRMRKYALKENNAFVFVIDTIGLAVFTVVGTRAGGKFENVFLEVFVGVVTGVGGGVIRDLFAGNKPYIFVKHFYACASMIGAIVTVSLRVINWDIAMLAGAIVIVALRFLAAKFRWSLPKA